MISDLVFKKKTLKILMAVFVLTTSLLLGFHNATLYQPNHGFDGSGHVFYIEYVNNNWKMPPPNLNWETHQSPLYYFLGAMLMNYTHTWKTAQYMNTIILWLIIGMVGLGLKKTFKNNNQVLLGMFSLAALPMNNIFPAMITNELLSTLWIVSAVSALLYLVDAKKQKQFILIAAWFTLSFILGLWTKISIITIVPTVIISFLLILFNKKYDNQHSNKFISRIFSLKNKIFKIKSDDKIVLKNKIIILFLSTILIISAYYPLFIRSKNAEGPSNIIKIAKRKPAPWPNNFYYRLDWIWKVDMYNTQYYSLLGGAWNSFWSDGQNAITPFIKFHKKAFILWSLGFILLPISLYGLKQLKKINNITAIQIYSVGLLMLGFYFFYNFTNGHYSAVRLTYEMGIIIPYSFGIATAAKSKRMQYLLTILLFIQFSIMVSFYWILPWWHVTR